MLANLKASARRRRGSAVLASSLPLLIAAAITAWRVAGMNGLTVALIVGSAATIAWLVRAMRAIDAAWVARQLDQRRPDLEDSTALLLGDPAALTSLQALQRARIERRLTESEPPDLRPAWPRRALALCWALGVAITAASLLLPSPHASAPTASLAGPGQPAPVGPPRLVEQHLDIEPPAYTGLAARSEDTLDARLPAGATLRWRLRFEPSPATVELVFHDRTRVPLALIDGTWTAGRAMDRSALYRVALDGEEASPATPPHRLEVIPDLPPSLRIVSPAQSVTTMNAGQRQWPLAFEASDDYGLGAARLQVTLAQGGGENISVSERAFSLRGDGDARRQRYAYALDLAPLGLAEGDDVIVHLSVDDNRVPTPNSARSTSLILRWPPEAGAESAGMEGIVKRSMPAYFRSQRQVIIDSEALIAQRRKLPAAQFIGRSDEIGVDQRLLRLRYGEFLGQETEDGGNAHADDEHAHAAPRAKTESEDSLLAEFAHTHDLPEAATLLDRETRALLKGALEEMWQAELHLRQGQPELALPYEYRALDRIKQVQQASRIYLARVGLELPPIDMSRRLTGDASGARNRRDALEASVATDPLPADVWRALDESTPAGNGSDARPDERGLDALEQWIAARDADLPNAIEMLAAVDALRADPQCQACRRRLQALLWPLLPVPPAATGTRARAGASAQAYLEALREEPRR